MPTIIMNGRQVQVNDNSSLLKNNQVVSNPASGTVGTPASLQPAYGSNISGGYQGGVPTYTPQEDAKQKIAGLGQQWAAATTPEERARIAAQSLATGTAAGGTRDAKTGTWTFGADPNAWAKDSVLNDLAVQKQAVDQQIAQMVQASQLGVMQNNAMLEENLQGLGEQKAKTEQNIVNFQNRRGGFYSGGTDFHLGNNTRGFAEAEGGLRKDVAARNADIWGRNALLAQQASEKISMLTQQAPSKIRELITGQQERDRAFAVQEAGVTGMYNNQPTYMRQIDERNFGFQKAQQDWENNFKQGQLDWQMAQQTWENAFQGRKFEQDMKEAAASRGLQWASLDQRQREFIADQEFREKSFQLDQDKFDFEKNQPGKPPAYDSTPEWSQEQSALNSDPQGSYDDYLKNPQDYIAAYGDDGYQKLLQRARALLNE